MKLPPQIRFVQKNSLGLGREYLRRKASKGMCHYAASIDIPGRPVNEDDPECELFMPVETALAEHHILSLKAIEKCMNTRHGRLMLMMPPGSAKSTYASVVAPSKYLGEQGGRKILLGSYGDDLVRKMGRRTRALIKQPKYRAIFDVTLSSDSTAVQEFALSNGSEYLAGGLLTGVTGNRAHGIIIDDPIKGREAANSEVIRNKTWDTYMDDWLTRLIPGGWVIMITTRWHQDDPAGRILPETWNGESGQIACRDGNIWTVICIQAKCERDDDPLGRERGEYMWPDWFDAKHWAQFESVRRTWVSLFQQLPTPDEGDLFKVDQIETIHALPVNEHITWARGWDLGATTDGNWTAGAKLGIKRNGGLIIGHMVRMREGPDKRDRAMQNTAKADGRTVRVSIPQDPGQAGKTQVLDLTRKMQPFCVPHFSPESGDKVTRAEPFAAQVNNGNVQMLAGPWNEKCIEEMRVFPNGTFDDQVDALSRAYALLITRAPLRVSQAAVSESERVENEVTLVGGIRISEEAMEEL